MCRRSSIFFFSSRSLHTRYWRDWSSDVCSSDLGRGLQGDQRQRVVLLEDGRTDDRRVLLLALLLLFVLVELVVFLLFEELGRLIVGLVVNVNHLDRKSVVQGKSVDLGGRRIIKK